jgi:hypothetical protein
MPVTGRFFYTATVDQDDQEFLLTGIDTGSVLHSLDEDKIMAEEAPPRT